MGEDRKIIVGRGELYYLEDKEGDWEILKISVVGSDVSTLFPPGIHQVERVSSGPKVLLGDIWDEVLEIDERDLIELCAKKISPEQALMISCVKKQAYHSLDLSELSEEIERSRIKNELRKQRIGRQAESERKS